MADVGGATNTRAANMTFFENRNLMSKTCILGVKSVMRCIQKLSPLKQHNTLH